MSGACVHVAKLHRTQELVLSSEIPRGRSQSGCPASLWGATRSLCAPGPAPGSPQRELPEGQRGQGAGRAGGDITSNGPECGNTVNKVYFTFNFDI